MVVVDQFLHLYESDQISSLWKVSQILLYVICGVSSVIAAYSFGRLNFYYLNDNCVLYSNVTFHKEHISRTYANINDLTEHTNVSRIQDIGLHIGPVNNMITEWGNPRGCSYCIYVPTCSFIFCFVWATFFTMCGRGGSSIRGLPSPWRIVCPALLFNSLYFVTSFVASAWLHSGLAAFCTNFKKNMDEQSCGALYRYASPPSHAVYSYLTVAKVFSWVTTVIWLLHIVCLILRCVFVADFDLYKIQIITAQPISSTKVKVKFEDLDGNASSPTPKKTPVASKRRDKSSSVINVIDNPASNFALKEKVSSLFRLSRADSSHKIRKPVTFEQTKNPLILVEDLSESSADTSEINSVEDNAAMILTELNEDKETALPDDGQKKPSAHSPTNGRETVELHGTVDPSTPVESTGEDEATGKVEDEIKKTDMTQLYSAPKSRISSPSKLETNVVPSDIVKTDEHVASALPPAASSEENGKMVEIFNANKSFNKSLIASVNALETVVPEGDEVAGTSRETEPSRSPDRKSTATKKRNDAVEEGTGTSGLLQRNSPVNEVSVGTSMSDLIQANKSLNAAKNKTTKKEPTKKEPTKKKDEEN